MDSNNLDKLKTALQQIESGVDVQTVKANFTYVNYDNKLINKINLLKKIPILNIDIIKYLYSIKLTDKIKDVEPKVNAIFQLAKNAKLITDEDVEKEEKAKKQVIIPDNEVQTAVNIINSLIEPPNGD